jgi:hypothetical protein
LGWATGIEPAEVVSTRWLGSAPISGFSKNFA